MGRDDDTAIDVARDLHAVLSERSGAELPVRLWDGAELGPSQATFRIVLNQPWALRAMLLPPTDLAAGEAFVRGDVDVEGDIVEALASVQALAGADLPLAERARLARALLKLPKPPSRPTKRRARLRGRPHGKRRDRAAISFHYDLPQEFYEAFLDPDLVYSCGYFAEGDDDLAHAQQRKLDLVCRKLRLEPGMRLLDIGCGWGSLLAHAAAHYGVTGVGVTLSQTQAAAGRQRLEARGLGDRVEIRLQDYRDLDEQFDAIASVGMVEHVGAANLLEYFSTAHELLADGGLFLSHGIVTAEATEVRRRKVRETFVSAYVFPDGELTPAWRAPYEAERAGFEVLDLEQLRPNYALTLRAWLRNLERNREAVIAASSEVDYRIWRAYMAGSAVGFETGRIGVAQLLSGKSARVPLGREWMLPSLPSEQPA